MKTFEEEKEEFLQHFGVKGMRWGKRKTSSSSSASDSDEDAKFKKDIAVAGTMLGTYAVIRGAQAGYNFMANNPGFVSNLMTKMSKAASSPALNAGAKIVTLKLKNGVWG